MPGQVYACPGLPGELTSPKLAHLYKPIVSDQWNDDPPMELTPCLGFFNVRRCGSPSKTPKKVS